MPSFARKRVNSSPFANSLGLVLRPFAPSPVAIVAPFQSLPGILEAEEHKDEREIEEKNVLRWSIFRI